MAIPITKKAAASCAKNMEEGTMAYKVDMALIEGEKNKAKSEGFTDIRKGVEEGFNNVKSKNTEEDED